MSMRIYVVHMYMAWHGMAWHGMASKPDYMACMASKPGYHAFWLIAMTMHSSVLFASRKQICSTVCEHLFLCFLMSHMLKLAGVGQLHTPSEYAHAS